jgi:hypothetical protein
VNPLSRRIAADGKKVTPCMKLGEEKSAKKKILFNGQGSTPASFIRRWKVEENSFS